MATEKQRPIKGILKNKGSETTGLCVISKSELSTDRDEDPSKKSQKWDEMNILATYHPSDKDYGLMKIDEPSTPYHRMTGDEEDEGAMSDSESNEVMTADDLAEKLAAAEGTDPKFLAEEESSDEEDEELTPEERERINQEKPDLRFHSSNLDQHTFNPEPGDLPALVHKKKEFEMKRRHHYNEGMNIKLARQLIAKELAGEDDDDDDDEDEEMQDVSETDRHPDQLQISEQVL